jgi:hypothetical protein
MGLPGLIATVVLAARLGYVSPGGPLGVVGSIMVANVSVNALGSGITTWLGYRHYPTHTNLPTSVLPLASP